MKKAATKEQRDEIFKIDKQKQYVRKKKQKKRKALENRLRKQKEAQDQCTCSINGTGINQGLIDSISPCINSLSNSYKLYFPRAR